MTHHCSAAKPARARPSSSSGYSSLLGQLKAFFLLAVSEIEKNQFVSFFFLLVFFPTIQPVKVVEKARIFSRGRRGEGKRSCWFPYICIPLTHQTCKLERDALIRNTTKLLYVSFLHSSVVRLQLRHSCQLLDAFVSKTYVLIIVFQASALLFLVCTWFLSVSTLAKEGRFFFF